MKKFAVSVLALSLIWYPAQAREASAAMPDLQVLIEEAVAGNPQLEAAVQRAAAAERAVSQAGALPDPQLTLGLMNMPANSFSFSQEPMTGKTISVMQMFPFPGKQSLAEDMAEREAEAVRFQTEEVRNTVVQIVKVVYYDIYAIDRALETVRKNKTLMMQFVKAAEAKYATGSGLQQDVLRAQVELSKMEDDIVMWEQKRKAAVARLNAVLNRPQTSDYGTILRTEELPFQGSPKFSVGEAERIRPLLQAWKERIRMAEAASRLAGRDIWPNFTLGASYNQRDDLQSGAVMHDFFSATISLNIPVFFKRKQSAKAAEKKLQLAAVRAEYDSVVSSVAAEIENLKADMERNRKRIELFRGGILVQAQQALDSAFAGYQVGKVDFLTLISNWMMLQNYELQHDLALADYQKSLAVLERALGREIGADDFGEDTGRQQ